VEGRTPAEAVNAFVEPIGRAVFCISTAVVTVGGGYYPAPQPHSLVLNAGSVTRLASDLFMDIGLRYRIVESVERRGIWEVTVVGYRYKLSGAAGQDIISYHWHPSGASFVTFPHVHIGVASRVGDSRVGQAHLPTGRVPPQSFLHLLITDFGVAPRRANWEQVLTETQSVFADWG